MKEKRKGFESPYPLQLKGILMVTSRKLTAYDTIDGKTFWSQKEATAHEQTLPIEMRFKHQYPQFKDADYDVSVAWTINVLRNTQIYIPEEVGGFLRAPQDGYYQDAVETERQIHGYGTMYDIISYVEKNLMSKFNNKLLSFEKLKMTDFSGNT